MNPNSSPIGIALGLLFFGAMLGFVRWMLTASRSAQQVSRARWIRANSNCIIVPLTEKASSREAVELACRLASDRKAEILLAHVIEIPLTLGLDVPLPDVEESAWQLLEASERIVKQHNLKVESRLLRNRTTAEGILELAREAGAEVIVVGTNTPSWWSFSGIERTVMQLLRCAPCKVVIAKAPLPA